MDTNKGQCPQCGKALEIPAELDAFSCMYCGARLTPADLTQPMPESVPEGDYDEAMAYVHTHLMDCVRSYPDYNKKITKKEYATCFEAYERGTSDLFEHLELACRLRPQQWDALIQATVTEFMVGLKAYFDEAGGKRRREDLMFNTKVVIALFLVPAVRHMDLRVSEDFVQELHRQWSEAYPKSPFQLGTYEDIVSGFRRGRFCFVTTAVCAAEGKDDDCAELTAFRAFRDGYLSQCPDGEALIAEYYNVAPGIVACIDHCGTPEDYAALRRDYLDGCYADLRSGRPARCKRRYTRMMRRLEKTYLS